MQCCSTFSFIGFIFQKKIKERTVLLLSLAEAQAAVEFSVCIFQDFGHVSVVIWVPVFKGGVALEIGITCAWICYCLKVCSYAYLFLTSVCGVWIMSIHCSLDLFLNHQFLYGAISNYGFLYLNDVMTDNMCNAS